MTSPEVVCFKEDSEGKEFEIRETSFPSLHGVREIDLITTAISHVVLVEAEEGGFVYKLRRRVKIGDLCDFSTLTRRREDCLREVKKNQLLAPDIYLEVVTATLRNQVLVFESRTGEVIDWAVKMRRFREEDKMDNLIKQGKVTKENILELAEVIVRFHEKLLVPKKAREYGSFENVRRIWDENFEQARELLGTTAIDEETILGTKERVEEFLRTNRSLF